MKKKLLVLIIIVLFTTGCTCEYNLKIDDNDYIETVRINADNDEELNRFNTNWKVPTDKEEYNSGEDAGATQTYKSDLYEYQLSNSTLTFTHTFDRKDIASSSAISNCYDMVTVKRYNGALILSTGTKVKCFNAYPGLNRVTITITTDKKVVSNNADYVSSNSYIWYLEKSTTSKSINMTIDDTDESETGEIVTPTTPGGNEKEKEPKEEKEKDYTFYIFALILLIVLLVGYYLYNKMKQKNEEMDL